MQLHVKSSLNFFFNSKSRSLHTNYAELTVSVLKSLLIIYRGVVQIGRLFVPVKLAKSVN